MVTILFGVQSRGEVTLKSADPKDNPVVDHKHFSDPLDRLVMAEGCRLANEIVLEGEGTKDVIKGSWPHHLTYHTQKDRSEWEAYVQRQADTCKPAFASLSPFPFYPTTTTTTSTTTSSVDTDGPR